MPETIKINAAGKPLGRLAARVAIFLQGKHKPTWRAERLESGAVLVFNVDQMKLSGRKAKQGVRYHHSSYPGGLKVVPVKKILAQDSRILLRRAIGGMLPKNKLRSTMLKRLQLLRANS